MRRRMIPLVRPCPTCNGHGKIMDGLGPPVPPDATPYERQEWPCVSLIWVVCETCNGEKYIEEYRDDRAASF